MKFTGFWGLLIVALVGVGFLGYANYRSQNTSPDTSGKLPCLNPNLPVPENLHWHPELKIIIDGKEVEIPAGVGIEGTCHRPLHTHEVDGVIHVEPNFPQDFYLKDFFAIWEKPFNSTQILDKKANSNYEIFMTVNGVVSREYENHLLENNQQIRIEYKKIGR